MQSKYLKTIFNKKSIVIGFLCIKTKSRLLCHKLCDGDVQGNIIALLDSAGNVVVKYVYDAWGNHAVLDGNGNDITDANHIGNLNPFRYRGYFYDVETELYYLQTRYYDPEIGRFITIDSIEYLDPESINGLNLYAYCGDNPVMGYDPNGTWDWDKFWEALGLIVTAIAAIAISVVTFSFNNCYCFSNNP